MVQMLAPDGTYRDDPAYCSYAMTDEQLCTAYRYMVQARAADEWAFSLNRQGRLGTYPPATGQEANSVGAVMALREDDWIVPTYRELGGLLTRGVPLKQFFLYWLGNEHGSAFERELYHVTPIVLPIGSQLPHAVGLAFAERYQGNDRIAIGFVGDGGTSEGDFHEALNFAALWQAGTIFFVQNNQYAISVPRSAQTASDTIAQKAMAYGFEGVQVDGNDVTAVYAVTAAAAARAREGGGPTLIEGVTYRIGPHTTSDDPKRYRSDDEVAEWQGRDPIVRLQKLLVTRGLMDDTELGEVIAAAREQARREFDAVELFEKPSLEDTYRYVYAELPPLMQRQMDERRRRMERTGT
jgi:pyruvate dehydrogenase E1 component alpha subunit